MKLTEAAGLGRLKIEERRDMIRCQRAEEGT